VLLSLTLKIKAEQYPKLMALFYQMRKEIPENSLSEWLYMPLIPHTYDINILNLPVRNTKRYI
jgi:hypothetical protein